LNGLEEDFGAVQVLVENEEGLWALLGGGKVLVWMSEDRGRVDDTVVLVSHT
jgi:hypothetical protein